MWEDKKFAHEIGRTAYLIQVVGGTKEIIQEYIKKNWPKGHNHPDYSLDWDQFLVECRKGFQKSKDVKTERVLLDSPHCANPMSYARRVAGTELEK